MIPITSDNMRERCMALWKEYVNDEITEEQLQAALRTLQGQDKSLDVNEELDNVKDFFNAEEV